MLSFFSKLFDTSDFPARWHCGSWTAGHGWLHILSDLGVWSAYVAIPCVLVYFVVRRKDLPFQKLFLLFGAFIIACGTTHLMEALIFWWPAYRLAGLIKLATALVSWATVAALVVIVPKALALRGPQELERQVRVRTAELARLNQELQAEIVERRRLEEESRERREWFQTTLSSIGDAVIATDAKGFVTLMNPCAESLTGWPQADAVGKPLPQVFEIVNEMTRVPVDNPVFKVLKENVTVGLANHTILISKDGTERPIDDSAAPIRSGAGEIQGVVLVFRDVTDRRRAELDRYRLAAIVESSDDAIIGKTLDGIVTSWNAGAERLFGYTSDEVVGKSISVLLPADREHELPDILQRLENGKRNFETERIRKDGSRLDVSITISPIRNAEGELVGASSIKRDVSERKRFERELRERAEQLSDADRRKDEFLAMLAHELRNPLAPIRTGLELLASGQRDDETLRVMQEQVTHMVRLVDDLLDVSRIMRGKIDLKRTPIEFGIAVSKALETVRPLIQQQRHEVVIHGMDQPIWLEADLVRLTQVISNLLNNAAKYTEPEGRIELTVERATSDVVLRVKDNGIGMDAALLPRIFDLFTQGDRAIDRAQGGLGIGLTLVKNLVAMHGGSVSAASDGEGQGSEFVVRLPALSERSKDASDVWMPLPVRKLRVLIVDDQAGAARLLSKTLVQFWGHEVHLAHDGLGAIEEARRLLPDLILLDIGLPGLSGYEVARRLREDPAFAKTTLVALTGYGQEDDRRRALDAGFNEHLVKPASVATLQSLFLKV